MGIKQDIVLVSQFSTRRSSRGKTPGKYILSYMLRDEASGAADYFAYMTRPDAADGRSFGRLPRGEPALGLTEREVQDLARAVQQGFDRGCAAIRTVISFDPAYLARTGAQNDPARIREAALAAAGELTAPMDDPVYAGAVHTNTAHVHVHLCMMDLGRGKRITKGKWAGEQKGKITKRCFDAARRALDLSLSRSKDSAALSPPAVYPVPDKEEALLALAGAFADQDGRARPGFSAVLDAWNAAGHEDSGDALLDRLLYHRSLREAQTEDEAGGTQEETIVQKKPASPREDALRYAAMAALLEEPEEEEDEFGF